jgi:hypothetical protein
MLIYARRWRRAARRPVVAAGMSSGLLVLWDTRNMSYPIVADVHEKAIGESQYYRIFILEG